ncbi:MAG: hypothetical protein ACKOPM_12945 [Novosphingobium sp.]
MPSSIPVTVPAAYAPVSAIGYAEADSTLSAVTASSPLPVTTISVPSPAALVGTAAASTLAGPFSPSSGKPVVLALSGTWSGTVRVLRSTDGGTTKLPLTAAGLPWGSYSANCCEPVWEETVAGAALYLDIALGSGSVTYRVAQ